MERRWRNSRREVLFCCSRRHYNCRRSAAAVRPVRRSSALIGRALRGVRQCYLPAPGLAVHLRVDGGSPPVNGHRDHPVSQRPHRSAVVACTGTRRYGPQLRHQVCFTGPSHHPEHDRRHPDDEEHQLWHGGPSMWLCVVIVVLQTLVHCQFWQNSHDYGASTGPQRAVHRYDRLRLADSTVNIRSALHRRPCVKSIQLNVAVAVACQCTQYNFHADSTNSVLNFTRNLAIANRSRICII